VASINISLQPDTAMTNTDWDPRSAAVLDDQIAAYDNMRSRCPVAHSDYLGWSLFRHADVLRVLEDPQTFSSAVSSHPSVPNGMDPPEHTVYRRIIDPYFGPDRMLAFEPICRAVAVGLVKRLPSQGEVDFMPEFAQAFALEIQCAFMGWPADLHEPLHEWTRKNHDATLSGDRARTAAVALEFDRHIRRLLDQRRQAQRLSGSDVPDDDVTTRIMFERVDDRNLTDEEIVSILRNWTVGELATIASSVGILAHYLAARPALQQQMRNQPSLLPPVIEEILRIHAPLIANSRRTLKAVKIGGREIAAGERITVIWASVNRDESVFGDPDELRPDRPGSQNLLYGAGIHVCPGAPLARMEMRIIMEELLAHTESFSLSECTPAARAVYPASGFSSLPIITRRGKSSAAQHHRHFRP
jgi:cytochrome P450